MADSYVEDRIAVAGGLDIAVVVNRHGFRCGYVRIPRSHPWYGLETADSIRGKRVPLTLAHGGNLHPDYHQSRFPDSEKLDRFLEPHGGLTFAGELATSGMEGDWWVGFDCAHLYDRRDEELMDETALRLHREYPLGEDGVVRSADYIRGECVALARQVHDAAKTYGGLLPRLRWLPRALRGPRRRMMVRPRLVLWGARRLDAQAWGAHDFTKLHVFDSGRVG